MHHLTCGISSLLHLFTVLLVHLILRISPHHSHHLRSHHLGPITASTFHSRHKTLSQILSSIATLIPSGLTSRILTCTELKGHCLFVLVSGYVCYKAVYSAFESTLNSLIVSYRIETGMRWSETQGDDLNFQKLKYIEAIHKMYWTETEVNLLVTHAATGWI